MSVLSKDRVREIFMAHGFTVKDGQTDLKPYVYAAAEALVEAAVRAEREGAEPVLYQYRFQGMYGDVWRTSPVEWNGLKPVETRALYTHPPQASATVPEGMVLVPIEPMESMLESARLATESEGLTTTTWLRNCVYRAMLAAAPSPETPT